MIARTVLVASAALLATSALNAQTVLNTDLPDVTASNATTVTTANGTVTTVTGAPRRTATPNGSWFQANVGGGGSVGITKTYTNDGNGAAFFETTSGDSKGDLQYLFAAPVALASLQSISYDWYTDASTANANGAFHPVLRFNMTKNGAFAGQLILEHVYQNQQAAPEGVWTTETATLSSGIWWASNAALGPTFANANGGQKTLSQWIADNAGSNLEVVGMNIGVGSGWAGTFSGALDNINYGFAGGPSGDVDFAVAAVPEPASWAMVIGGFAFVGSALRRRAGKAAHA